MGDKVKSLVLPMIPKDYAYEDYVASVLNVGGYYLERGIHKREESEVLELDIVTNKFSADGVDKTISEIKSGGWGFPEIFKVRGWLDYLGFDKASFVVQKTDQHQSLYQDVSSKLNINLIATEEDNGYLKQDQIREKYSINVIPHENPFVVNLRFSYALERKLIKDIQSTAKNGGDNGFKELKEYIFNLCDNVFFEQDSCRKIYKTFKLFIEHQHITAILDNINETSSYSSLKDQDLIISKSTFEALFYKHDTHNKLYGPLYVEMLNRLHVLKHCVEDMLQSDPNQKVDIFLSNIAHDALPTNIKDAMELFKKHKFFYLYPHFWQIFIFLFGGFILVNKKKDEYGLLSEITGVPVDEINNALSAFNILFPIDGGWFQDVHKTSIRLLKFMPSPFCGIGVNLRKDIYCPNYKLEELMDLFDKDYTYNDLMRYNNLAFQYLSKSDDVVKIKEES